MRGYMFLPLLVLAACATPQQRCVSSASKDLRVLEGLIQTTRANLVRGYAIDRRKVLVNTQQVCGRTPKGKEILCDVAVSEDQSVAVAIDLDAERAKLESMLDRREDLLAARDTRISQCLAQYPEI